MGFRFRKSLNLGGGFRINFSKSGIGYSFGGKGFRYTKTAHGTTRTTLSIPGTGVSWVQENNNRNKNIPIQKFSQPDDFSSYYLYSIQNADDIISADRELFVATIKRFIRLNRLFSWVSMLLFCIYCISIFQYSQNIITSEAPIIISLWLLIFSIIGKIIYRFDARVKAIYQLDAEGSYRTSHIDAAINCLKSCSAIWQINDFFSVSSRRNAGASRTVGMTKLSIKRKKPYFLRTNVNCYYIKLKSEKLYLLPDTILIVKKRKLGSIAMSDLNITVSETRFVENIAPKDAEIVDHTWQYVNNNGTPDKRFKNNWQRPVCRYGVLDFQAPGGFHTRLYLSKIQAAIQFNYIVSELIQHNQQ